ncbi:alpha,alpha-trehalase TreF [Flavobacteriaceae bacterium F89]|uniref:Alpha,alpha-trehalase TreF n=1 Tax=Cerina litoralis TaxID=2874477 RepID=A0AAE3EW07_9FLAO|nr:alpha,alpha-trehalase TreF [Cerina litoralis]MCG2460721.1 alpha,alpha-trehalase TreF [Cerina litoralis]
MKIFRLFSIFLLIFSLGCQEGHNKKGQPNFYQTELFKDVQLQGIFKDSKTFVDLLPDRSTSDLATLYLKERKSPGFDLRRFIGDHFSDRTLAPKPFVTDTSNSMHQHISNIWSALTRGPDSIVPYSSRIPLPNAYVVPGGRFQEIYYWDSYFTLEGLLVDGKEMLATDMVDNFSFLIDSLGFIPNGTRTYYLSRSQPPFYTLMVDALAGKDNDVFLRYFPYIVKEYNFWMSGESDLKAPFTAKRQVVKMGNGMVLNRYWDKLETPRPEAYKEDFQLASGLKSVAEKKALYANLRAGAASGWDFSSRWYGKEGEFNSTSTTTIVPVDLNSLMYFMETQIARGYGLKGDKNNESLFLQKAATRKKNIQEVFWDEGQGFFTDFNFVRKKGTNALTLAGAYPLFFKIATPAQAEKVKDHLLQDFLRQGGLVTTLKHTGQQWDAPNGWAPLQWMAVNGLLNYGYKTEAQEIMQRWLQLNERVYKNTGKMMEKYNVEDTTLLSGGGEYDLQDGFGWTNGVVLGFEQLLKSIGEEKVNNVTVPVQN